MSTTENPVTEEKKQTDQSEMPKPVSSDGFMAPDTNAFGHAFKKIEMACRNDDNADCSRQKSVQEFYQQQHINQTYDFVKKIRQEYSAMNRAEMSIWECCELLNTIIDDSDPDLDEPQIQHALQPAEAIRKDYPDED